jgi:hypothetical protein
MRASLFQNIWVDAVAALSEETFDSLDDAHMSWTPMIVDQQGWEKLTALLLHALEGVLELQKECVERLIAGDEEGISCTVSILGYPAAVDKRKVGPPIEASDLATATKQPKTKTKGASSKKTKTTRKSPAKKAASKSRRRKSAGK